MSEKLAGAIQQLNDEEVQSLRAEIARLRLTDAEREAVEWASIVLAADKTYSSALRELARRLGGDR